MDSLSQIALGSAVGIAVMAGKTPLWKAALVGAIYGTLPDLDVLIDRGNPIRDMTLHRTESHALFYLTLASPIFAWCAAKFAYQMPLFKRWWLATWLVLVTHPLLDTLTIYGTQLALPFSNYPFGTGSVFIIDPLYTLPLLIGVIGALRLKEDRGIRWNNIGLAVSSAYLMWGLVAQFYVAALSDKSLAAQGINAQQRLVTATPFNTMLWRILVMTPQGYAEGYYSFFDKSKTIRFVQYPSEHELLKKLPPNSDAHRLAEFAHGYVKVAQDDKVISIADLRMGFEPFYSFNFDVAIQANGEIDNITPKQKIPALNIEQSLTWLHQRLFANTDQTFPEFLHMQ